VRLILGEDRRLVVAGGLRLRRIFGRVTASLSMNDLPRNLHTVEQGGAEASEQLLPLVYDELRKLAAQRLAHEAPGQTLLATDLVHEAYMRLVNVDVARRWDNRGHFFAAAAEAMRRILVESARRKRSHKRGGGLVRHDLDEVQLAAPELGEDILALDEALARLAVKDPVKAQLVELRHFAGLSIEQAAQALGLSTTTAYRYWNYARAWLHQDMLADSAADADDPASRENNRHSGKKRT
jgi:RNA polymerase sigma factor (TIGR02999 family)